MNIKYLLALFAALFLIVGCGQTAEEVPSTPDTSADEASTTTTEAADAVDEAPVEAAAPATGDVVLQGKAGFDPSEYTIAVGGTVTFLIQSDSGHTLSIIGDSQARSARLSDGETWEWTFEEAGSYDIFDSTFKKRVTIIVE